MKIKGPRTFVYVSTWLIFGIWFMDEIRQASEADVVGVFLFAEYAIHLILTALVFFIGGLILINRI